jgi:hypothetical protein
MPAGQRPRAFLQQLATVVALTRQVEPFRSQEPRSTDKWTFSQPSASLYCQVEPFGNPRRAGCGQIGRCGEAVDSRLDGREGRGVPACGGGSISTAWRRYSGAAMRCAPACSLAARFVGQRCGGCFEACTRSRESRRHTRCTFTQFPALAGWLMEPFGPGRAHYVERRGLGHSFV